MQIKKKKKNTLTVNTLNFAILGHLGIKCSSKVSHCLYFGWSVFSVCGDTLNWVIKGLRLWSYV